MSITQLDPVAALIVIDLQKGIVSYPTAHPMDDVVKNAGALAAAFRRHGLPVVLVNVAGGAPQSGLGEAHYLDGTRAFPAQSRKLSFLVAAIRPICCGVNCDRRSRIAAL